MRGNAVCGDDVKSGHGANFDQTVADRACVVYCPLRWTHLQSIFSCSQTKYVVIRTLFCHITYCDVLTIVPFVAGRVATG
eukprot:6202842-Pleurochrysis_carterae.AAC.7